MAARILDEIALVETFLQLLMQFFSLLTNLSNLSDQIREIDLFGRSY